MRITLTVAAFTIAAFLPTTGHAEAGDAGDAGASSVSDAGAASEVGGSSAAGAGGSSAGKGGSSAGAGGRVPAVNLPDPGTDQTNSCSIAGPHAPLGVFGTTLALGAAFLTLRRKRPR